MPSPKSLQERLQAVEAELASVQKELRQLAKRLVTVGAHFQTVQDKKKAALIKARIG